MPKSFKIVTHPRINSKSKISSKYHQLKKFQILPYKGKQWKQWQTLFFWAPKSLQMVTAAMKLKDLLLGRKCMTDLDIILKSRDISLPTKVHLVKAMVFPVVMYGCELDYKES